MDGGNNLQDASVWPVAKGPVIRDSTYDENPVICNNCGYINPFTHNFCTNCGHPQQPTSESLAKYKYKLFKRKQELANCSNTIKKTRITLYVISAMILLGVVYVVPALDQSFLRAFVLILIAIIYFTLARWSLSKPFTAFLIGFLMIISFLAINTWAGFNRLFTSGTGMFLLAVQITLSYFLYHGVKAAYQADQIEEADKL